MENFKPLKTPLYKNFYMIPNFSRYVIRRCGTVLNVKLGSILTGTVNRAGYFNYGLTDDSGRKTTVGRHRLLLMAFKKCPGDFKDYQGNHLNSIPGDDRLSNLSWVTPVENVEYAGQFNNSSKCLPIEVMCCETSTVLHFPSAAAAGRALNLSRDVILYRVRSNGRQVFSDNRLYRQVRTTAEWLPPEEWEHSKLKTGRSRVVAVKDCVKNTVTYFDSQNEAAKHIGMSISSMSQWLNREGQPVVPGMYQLQRVVDLTDWRDTDDLNIELALSMGHRPIIAIDPFTDEFFVYPSCREAAIANNYSFTMLNYILNCGGGKINSDSLIYKYYK